jgi:AcrR family transcriptional regulator
VSQATDEGVRTIGYHHGDLRRTIQAAAIEAITQSGPNGWSLRELARRAGVSHAAPAHHFGDKPGLLTAIAVEGFTLLAEEVQAAGPDFLEAGLAYIRFAVAHPAHFTVMFTPGLYRADDPEVDAARTRADQLLQQGAQALTRSGTDSRHLATAGWSIAHGFASLWLSGALSAAEDEDPAGRARPALRLLVEERRAGPQG